VTDDAVIDLNTGFVRLASPPYFPITATIEKDDRTGPAYPPVPYYDAVENFLTDYMPNASFSYATTFDTAANSKLRQALYFGSKTKSPRKLLSQMYAGMRQILFGNRDGELDVALLGSPEDASVDVTIEDDQISFLSINEAHDPAHRIELTYNNAFAKFSDADVSLLLPYSQRKSLLKGHDSIVRTGALTDNKDRYSSSSDVLIPSMMTGFSSLPNQQNLDSEMDEWVRMLGVQRHYYTITVPLGLIETKLGMVVGLKVPRLNIWNGHDSDGRKLYIIEYTEDFSKGTTELVLWC
jgi:hypothetical protein